MIPFVDLQGQYQAIRDEVRASIDCVLDSGQYVLGPEVVSFEEEFAAYTGTAFGIGVNSGTSALHLALLAAGVGPGDEVVTVPFTFVATVAAVRYVGATPIFVDIEPGSFMMDVGQLEAALTPRTKAVIPVHLYGESVDMDPILAIARRRGIVVIEDAAQAHGARYKGRPVGGLGDFGCFSFYPGKNLGAYGEGGMIVTNDAQAAERLRMLRDWGAKEKYHHECLGFNYRMEGIQGAILRVKLRRLDTWNKARRTAATLYHEFLKSGLVTVPGVRPHNEHVFHIYAVRVREREALRLFLQKRGIQTGIHYPIPVHLQKGYADPRYPPGSLPCAEAASREVLSLPLFPEITKAQIKTVAQSVIECVGLQSVAA
jgi:dTDP-4-amino-4,6-dideoxygalactose transaminase